MTQDEVYAARDTAERWIQDRGEYITPTRGLTTFTDADVRIVYAYADQFAKWVVALADDIASEQAAAEKKAYVQGAIDAKP